MSNYDISNIRSDKHATLMLVWSLSKKKHALMSTGGKFPSNFMRIFCGIPGIPLIAHIKMARKQARKDDDDEKKVSFSVSGRFFPDKVSSHCLIRQCDSPHYNFSSLCSVAMHLPRLQLAKEAVRSGREDRRVFMEETR